VRRREAGQERSRRPPGVAERIDLDVDGRARILLRDELCFPGLRKADRRSARRANHLVARHDPGDLDDDVEQRDDAPHGFALHADDEIGRRPSFARAGRARHEQGNGAESFGVAEEHDPQSRLARDAGVYLARLGIVIVVIADESETQSKPRSAD
jgi:hypothetical protein